MVFKLFWDFFLVLFTLLRKVSSIVSSYYHSKLHNLTMPKYILFSCLVLWEMSRVKDLGWREGGTLLHCAYIQITHNYTCKYTWTIIQWGDHARYSQILRVKISPECVLRLFFLLYTTTKSSLTYNTFH